MSGTTLAVAAPKRGMLATTPARMRAALAIIAVLAVVAAGTALTVVGDIRRAVQTIGYDAEPSVVAAQKLSAHLAAMDALAIADSLNENGSAMGTSRAFLDRLAVVNATLVDASRNITYGENEAAPIRALMGDLQRYLVSLGEGRWMARDDTWLAIRRARWSSRLVNEFAIPDAAALEKANLDPLETEYAAYQSSSVLLDLVAFAAFAVFLVSLIGTQVFLLRRTRRLINIPLAAATALTAVAMIGFGIVMLAEQADTRAAKEDAFDSIHALYGAKNFAYDMAAERAMWLLDPETRGESTTRFKANAQAVLGLDLSDVKATGAALDALSRALDMERNGRSADAARATPKLGGRLGDELGNITFGMPERQAASDSVVALANYLAVDREIVRLEQARQHVEAVALATSARPGGSVAAFNAFDDALDRTIAVNDAEFKRRTGDAISLLGWLPWATCGALAGAVLLAGAGIWQRWREYR
jgi:hypothetical protein